MVVMKGVKMVDLWAGKWDARRVAMLVDSMAALLVEILVVT